MRRFCAVDDVYGKSVEVCKDWVGAAVVGLLGLECDSGEKKRGGDEAARNYCGKEFLGCAGEGKLHCGNEGVKVSAT